VCRLLGPCGQCSLWTANSGDSAQSYSFPIIEAGAILPIGYSRMIVRDSLSQCISMPGTMQHHYNCRKHHSRNKTMMILSAVSHHTSVRKGCISPSPIPVARDQFGVMAYYFKGLSLDDHKSALFPSIGSKAAFTAETVPKSGMASP